MFEEHVTGRRQPHPAAGAVEQPDVERALQALDLPGQRRLGQIQPLRGPAVVEFLGDRDESPKLLQRQVHTGTVSVHAKSGLDRHNGKRLPSRPSPASQPQGVLPVPKLAALFSPERAADVVDPETRRLLEDRFEVVWATSEHAAGPGSAAKPPALDAAAVSAPPSPRRLLKPRLGVVGAPPEPAAAPGPAAKPPALDAAAVPELAAGADVLLTSWGTPQLGKELWSDGNGPQVVAHAA